MKEEVRKKDELDSEAARGKTDKKDPERLAQTFLEQIVVNQEFRELAEFLKSIRYLHIVPHLVRDPERSIGRHDDPFGGDFLEKVASTPSKTRDARLRNINKALKFAIPQFDSLTLQQDAGGRWHLEARFGHWRHSAARQYERSFSDGTLRLIGVALGPWRREAARCCWRNPSSPCTTPWCDTCRASWPECIRSPAGKLLNHHALGGAAGRRGNRPRRGPRSECRLSGNGNQGRQKLPGRSGHGGERRAVDRSRPPSKAAPANADQFHFDF